MYISDARSKHEIEYCVKAYLIKNKEGYFSEDFSQAMATMYNYLFKRAFFKVLRDDNDNIVAWILAIPNKMSFSKDMHMQQLFYHSDLKGYKAVIAIKLLHESLIAHSAKKNIKYVMSQCSPFDEELIFVKILETLGWKRFGHTAIWTNKGQLWQ